MDTLTPKELSKLQQLTLLMGQAEMALSKAKYWHYPLDTDLFDKIAKEPISLQAQATVTRDGTLFSIRLTGGHKSRNTYYTTGTLAAAVDICDKWAKRRFKKAHLSVVPDVVQLVKDAKTYQPTPGSVLPNNGVIVASTKKYSKGENEDNFNTWVVLAVLKDAYDAYAVWYVTDREDQGGVYAWQGNYTKSLPKAITYYTDRGGKINE